MATRSRIAIENPDGTVSSIYCHWDGSLNTNGVILSNHYEDRGKVERLIALGSISSLAEHPESDRPDSDHSFNNPEGGVTVAYHRDRGEKLCAARKDRDRESFFKSDIELYGYLFTLENKWEFVTCANRNPRNLYDFLYEHNLI
jgi:hypothetical protein